MHLETNKSQPDKPIDAQDLTCPICMSIAEDPHVSSCCGRVFCGKDANTGRYDNGCPLCRQSNYTFQSSELHRAALEQVTMKCACSERILPQDYDQHQERCSKVTFPCPHTTCREKNDKTLYSSQQLVNHLARCHCDEVPLLGSTYINKKSLEPYKKSAEKYDELVSTLYSSLYPKIIETQLKSSPSLPQTSSVFKCPSGHPLIDADAQKRKRKNGTTYSTPGFNCDVCHRTFSTGQSWHCSCSDSGFDKCNACLVFQLYDLDDETLEQASKDYEEQQQRYRRRLLRNTVRLPRGLFRLLTGHIEDDDDDSDHAADTLALREHSLLLTQPHRFDETDDDEIEVNLRED